MIPKTWVRGGFENGNDEAAALAWRDKLAKDHPDRPIDISYFGPVIGTHLGEKALALGWMEEIYN